MADEMQRGAALRQKAFGDTHATADRPVVGRTVDKGPSVRDLPGILRGEGAKKAVGDAPVIPILLVLTGGYLAWFGIHYWRDQVTIWPTDPVKAVLQGHSLPEPSRAQPVIAEIEQSVAASGGGPSPAGNITSVTGQQIAADARKYVSQPAGLAGTGPGGTGNRWTHPYVWGGASPSGWDCSGFVNYVICHDMKLSIPGYKGGTFTGKAHGPTVGDWIAWSGVKKVTSPQAGDIVCWGPDIHMGIALDGKQLISAEDPANGTQIGDIQGFFTFPPVILRLRETLLGTAPAPGPGGRYSHGALEGLWRLAGGNPAKANLAAAVGQAESRGDPEAESSNPDGGTNVGVWQLDTPGGKGAGFSISQLKDALINARVTVKATNNGQDWSAWETFVNGDYRKFLAAS